MKVNTDGVLLGAWVNANMEHPLRILDVGTGSGLIAIMLAQRCPLAQIDAVEIHQPSCRQAIQNAANSPWGDRLNVIHADFKVFAEQTSLRYDLIVSNPPYFMQSLRSPSAQRNVVRHDDSLAHIDLITYALKLLTSQGHLAVVLPYVEGSVFIARAATAGLFCMRKLNVATKRGRSPKRLLLEFSRERQACLEQDLFVENEALNSYTDTYKALTKDFYLKFLC